jgi:hypothetical protein
MKRTGQVLLWLLIVSAASVAATPDKGLITLFQDAMYQEQTAGDLDKAIELYQKVVQDAAEVEKLAAKATFQLGMCYLKKDDKPKAVEYFKKVVSTYPAQKEIVAQTQKQLEQIAPQSSGDSGFFARLPESVLNRISSLYGQLWAEALGKQVFSNDHVYFVDTQFNCYSGGYNYFMNRSSSPTSGKIDLGGTSYPNQSLYAFGGKAMNVEFIKSETQPNYYRIFSMPETPVGPWQVFFYGWCKNEASKLTSDGNIYSLKMQNHFGERVLEAFYLVVPDKVNMTSPSENCTSKESLDGYTIYSWKKEMPQNTEHIVRVALALLRDVTSEELAKIVKNAVETISTCGETDPRIKDATNLLAGLDCGLVVTEVCKYLDSDTDTIRRAAIYTLWKGGLPDITAAEAKLITLCSHKENLTRGMAALTLSSIKTPASLDAIKKMAEDSDGYARRCAVYALCLYGDSATIPIVEKALKDNDPMVKANAQAAMTVLIKSADGQSKAAEAKPVLMQEIYNDIQPDGTIKFKSPDRIVNTGNEPITETRFINSDFVQLAAITDQQGKPIPFTAEHDGDIYRYHVTFNNPVLPGETMVYFSEGTMTGLIKPVADASNTFRYSMTHSPATGQPTLRIEQYLLPAGAEVISTMSPDMQQSVKDGRIELKIEKVIPANGSLATSFKYKLAK